jgi:hypothetical protein
VSGQEKKTSRQQSVYRHLKCLGQSTQGPNQTCPKFQLSGIDGQMGQARWAGTETARKSTALERPGTEGSCLGPARHDCRAVPGPPPRHGGPTRARHEIGPARCQPVNFGLLRAHPIISYKNQNSPNPNPNSPLLLFLMQVATPPPTPRLGAEPAASSSATARRRASRLLLRHGQAAPAASSSATAMCRAGRLPSSAMVGPRRPPSPPPRPGRTLATASSPTARPHAGRFSSSAAAAAGSRIAAEEGSAPPVVGAQSARWA